MTDIHNYYSNINNSNVNFNQKLQNSAYNAFLYKSSISDLRFIV